MEYYFGILNRTYQVFVTPSMISGAFVHGIMVSHPFTSLYWFDPSTYVSKLIANRYKRVDVESEGFRRMFPFNFQYPRSEVSHASYSPTLKWGMGYVAHSGKLYVELASGRKREFILLGLQQGTEILDMLMPGIVHPSTSTQSNRVYSLLQNAYAEPKNKETWSALAQLFRSMGEAAQATYCELHAHNLS